jgi:non-heme chloroperoxidase
MSYFTTKDGTEIFYKDWGAGRPIVFSHGWPLSSDAWDAQMMYFGQNGYRVIAHDRRGHGRSSQTWDGNNMDTYASDLATLLETLNVEDAILIGHSTGGGEVARYLGKYGTRRVAKAVLIGAVTPILGQTPSNPNGVPKEVFDGMRASVLADRSQLFQDLTIPFYGYNRPGVTTSQGIQDSFWLQGMQCSVKAAHDCIQAFSETDFSDDLTSIRIPLLIMHGDDDQIVPWRTTAQQAHQLASGSELKLYPGFSHGLCTVNAAEINRDLQAFIES